MMEVLFNSHSRILSRGQLFGVLIVAALISFEVFNYGTTEFALNDLLGSLTFAGIPWSTILTIAFCGIDFAGIARIFTPEAGSGEPIETWYLFAAWLLAALMNAILTWWGVSIALLNQAPTSMLLADESSLVKIIPIFIAIFVWVVRVLIIGTISVSGGRLFSQKSDRYSPSRYAPVISQNSMRPTQNYPPGGGQVDRVPRPIPTFRQGGNRYTHREPTYHSLDEDGDHIDHPATRSGRF